MITQRDQISIGAIALLGFAPCVCAQIDTGGQLIVSANNGAGGALSIVDVDAPFADSPRIEAAGSPSVVRSFLGQVYVVDRENARIDVRHGQTLALLDSFPLGPAVLPMDILVVNAQRAFVTDFNGTHLIHLNLNNGHVSLGVDLTPLADDDGLPEPAFMARDGDLVFIQIQRVDRVPNISTLSALAVIDVNNPLVLIDPNPPGSGRLPGIELMGRRPSFKMHVDSVNRRLLVSTPGFDNDGLMFDTGIEEIDLDALQSLGFFILEDDLGADVGAFVMVTPDRGFLIAHTSIVASSHLRIFEREAGQIVELHASLFARLDTLVYDPVTNRIFYPTNEADPLRSYPPGTAFGTVFIYDALTGKRLASPIDAGGVPFDMTLVRPVAVKRGRVNSTRGQRRRVRRRPGK